MLKRDKDGNVIVRKDDKGNELVIGLDIQGKEKEFNAEGFLHENGPIRVESEERRKTITRMESDKAAQDAMFEGIDPKKAKENAAIVEKLGPDGKLVIDQATEAVNKTWQGKYDTDIASLQATLGGLQGDKINNALILSPELLKTTAPASDFKALYGGFCKPDGTFTDRAGNPLMSMVSPGKPATMEEAAKNWIDTHPAGPDSILKSGAKGGDDAHEGKNDQQPGDKSDTKSRTDLVSEAFGK